MRISFRQGINRYPYSGVIQNFLTDNGATIALNANNGPTEVNFAHRGSNYLHIENASVAGAWTVAVGVDQWLYWDIDLSTGARTFGTTIVAPVFGPTEPTSPVADLHWFNTTTTIMYVYQSGAFVEVVRVFAAKFDDAGGEFSSMSAGLPNLPFAGTQVGIIQQTLSGRIIFDNLGKLIVRENSELFTTEDQFFASGAQINSVRLESNVHYAKASETIAAFSVVKYATNGQITPAVYNDSGTATLAIVAETITGGDTGATIIQGVIKSTSWSWDTIGAELWVSTNGLLTDIDPNVSDPVTNSVKRVAVARVLSSTEIIFEQGLGGVGKTGPTGPTGTTTGGTWGTITGAIGNQFDLQTQFGTKSDVGHTQAATTVTFAGTAGGVTNGDVNATILGLESTKANAAALSSYLLLAGGTMTGNITMSSAEVIGLPTTPTVSTAAASKAYVDAQHALQLNLAGGTLTGPLVLAGSPTLPLHAATKQYVDNSISAVSLTAANTSFAPYGGSPEGISATNVQSALEELYDEKLNITENVRPYDVAGQIVGLPDASATVLRFIAARVFRIESVGTVAMADIASTGTADFSVLLNGSPIMTISFATSATGTVTMTGSPVVDIDVAINDIITVTAPGSQDATLSDIEFTILGNIYYAPPVPAISITGEQTVLPVDFGAIGSADDFARAFTLVNGPIDDTLTEYTTIAYNDNDFTNPDSFPVAYTVGDGTNDWYDVGTGPSNTTTVVFDTGTGLGGPTNDTWTGVGPWDASSQQESSTGNGYWYYVQVTVYNVGATSNSTSYCYCKAEAGG